MQQLQSADQYSIAGRHTEQSWLERFKKNSVPFTKRIERLVEDGVDETLKTERERADGELPQDGLCVRSAY